MNERQFDLRLTCRYTPPDNTVTDLAVEQRDNGVWRSFVLDAYTPGFLIFVYGVFTCQHLYMRVNCAERGLLLGSASGSIRLVTSEDWRMTKLRVEFAGELREGTPSQDAIDYIVGRMLQCPVSKNLTDIAENTTILRLQ